MTFERCAAFLERGQVPTPRATGGWHRAFFVNLFDTVRRATTLDAWQQVANCQPKFAFICAPPQTLLLGVPEIILVNRADHDTRMPRARSLGNRAVAQSLEQPGSDRV